MKKYAVKKYFLHAFSKTILLHCACGNLAAAGASLNVQNFLSMTPPYGILLSFNVEYFSLRKNGFLLTYVHIVKLHFDK